MQTPVYQSDIPPACTEKFISPYRESGSCQDGSCGYSIWYEIREYWLHGQRWGIRHFDEQGRLMIEYPYLRGKLHGTHYRWHQDGGLDITRPYVHGKLHGPARQWSPEGDFMGISHFVEGTGCDLWYQPYYELEKPGYYLAEILPFVNGLPHGTERWYHEDQQTVWKEMHYWQGNYHGIERWWYGEELTRESPRFFIHNEEVDQEAYIKAAGKDLTLPRFNEQEQWPQRIG